MFTVLTVLYIIWVLIAHTCIKIDFRTLCCSKMSSFTIFLWLCLSFRINIGFSGLMIKEGLKNTCSSCIVFTVVQCILRNRMAANCKNILGFCWWFQIYLWWTLRIVRRHAQRVTRAGMWPTRPQQTNFNTDALKHFIFNYRYKAY